MQFFCLTGYFRKISVFLVLITLVCTPSLTFAAGMGKIVTANRGSGTISIIDAGSDQVIDTVNLPVDADYPNNPEPMYVVNTSANNRVWVGDRANNRVVVFDGNSFIVEASVPAGNGVFHMWADQAGHQLWVVNDIDDTVTIIDPQTLTIIETVDMPADLTDLEAKPHDVMLDPQGDFAYVSFIFPLGFGNDVVVQFDTSTFQELNRADVGNDPHLSFNRKNGQLYVPCQGADAIFILDAFDLSFVDMIDLNNAHGAITSTNSKRFYTTNISDNGVDAVFAIDTTTNTVLGSADSLNSVPHNLTLTPNGKKLYLTHSGPNNTVSIFETVKNSSPIFLYAIEVGDNPFGLTHVR